MPASASDGPLGIRTSVRAVFDAAVAGNASSTMHPKIPQDQSSPLDGIMEDAPPRDDEMPELDKAADARNRKLTLGEDDSEEVETITDSDSE